MAVCMHDGSREDQAFNKFRREDVVLDVKISAMVPESQRELPTYQMETAIKDTTYVVEDCHRSLFRQQCSDVIN